MKDHHTITEKMCRDATNSHPYTSRHLGKSIEVIQSKQTNSNYTRSAQCVILVTLVNQQTWDCLIALSQR